MAAKEYPIAIYCQELIGRDTSKVQKRFLISLGYQPCSPMCPAEKEAACQEEIWYGHIAQNCMENSKKNQGNVPVGVGVPTWMNTTNTAQHNPILPILDERRRLTGTTLPFQLLSRFGWLISNLVSVIASETEYAESGKAGTEDSSTRGASEGTKGFGNIHGRDASCTAADMEKRKSAFPIHAHLEGPTTGPL